MHHKGHHSAEGVDFIISLSDNQERVFLNDFFEFDLDLDVRLAFVLNIFKDIYDFLLILLEILFALLPEDKVVGVDNGLV